MPRKKWREMCRNTNRAHPGTTTAVRNGKRLVKIQMTYVGADRRGAGETHLRIHVRAVHVHLTPELMDYRADLLNSILEHSMCRWIRHHQRGQAIAILFSLRLEVCHIDVAIWVCRNHHHFEACHHSTRG